MLDSLFNLFFSVLEALPGLEWFIGLLAAASFYGCVGLFKNLFSE